MLSNGMVIVKRPPPSRVSRLELISLETDSSALALIEIHGKIVNEEGEALEGATIRVKGSLISTSSGPPTGCSPSRPPPTPTLIISFIGYDTREVAVNDQTSLNVQLRRV